MALNGNGTTIQGNGSPYVPPAILLQSRPWHRAYMEALFEPDRSRIAERIEHAERMIVARERELFTGATDSVEQRAVVSALHALRALRACLHL